MSQVLLIEGDGRTARPFEHGPAFMGQLAIAREHFPSYQEFLKRRDAQVAAAQAAVLPQGSKRRDALTGVGLHQARQLEYVHQRVLEEKHPTPNGLSMFRISTEVPIGARTHTVRRYLDDGEVAVFRGSAQDVPRVGVSQVEEQFPVRYYVTSIRTNLFESLSSDYAGTGELERKMRTARRLMEAFANRMTWGIGPNQNAGLYGVLNYPWLAKKVSGVLFDGTASVDDVLAELQNAANYPTQASKSTFAPNRCATSTRVRDYLMNTRLGSVNDTTIGEFFTRNNAHIDAIEEAWELEGIAGADVDGILFYNDSQDGVSNEIPQGMTPLPAQTFGFDSITYLWMAHGGVIMRDVGGNLLLLVTAA